MPRSLVLLVVLCAVLATARPADAQDDGGTSTTTTTSSTTTSTTTTTTPPSSTTTTAPDAPPPSTPEDGTSSTVPEQDPEQDQDAADEELPPEEVPVSDVTVPPEEGGEPVDGAAASRIIRRELEVARAEAVESEQEVAEAARAVDQLSDRLATTQRELARLSVAQDLAVQRLDLAEQTFRDRVADAVVRGGASALDSVIGATDINEVETGRVMLGSVAEADQEAVEEYLAAKSVVDDAVLELVDDVARTRRELRAARDHLEEVLEFNAERRFQLAVFSAGSEIVIRGFVFPVGEPYRFIDSWGFPRMTGTEYEHGHQGTDIMAPFNTELYAVERGVVIRVGTDVLGGTKLWVKGRSGTYYYYAHLQSFAEGISEGTPVEAGDVVGYVGDTGNAKGGDPHLHFQVHPGGGEPVNPYGLLRVVSDLSRG